MFSNSPNASHHPERWDRKGGGEDVLVQREEGETRERMGERTREKK